MDTWAKGSRIRLAAGAVSAGLLLGGCADLVVTNVHDEPYIGSARQVKVTVKNRGWISAPASTTRLDVKPAGASAFTPKATASTPALASGQQIEFPISTLLSTEIPAAGSGQCLELKACADSEDAVWEGWFWDSNNCKTARICH